MAIALEFRFIGHTFYYIATSYIMSRFAPYIPIAEAGGFTPASSGGYGAVGKKNRPAHDAGRSGGSNDFDRKCLIGRSRLRC